MPSVTLYLLLIAGIPKFILISVHDYNLPSFLLESGYFKGKRKAESEVLSKFPSSGTPWNVYFSLLATWQSEAYDSKSFSLKLLGKTAHVCNKFVNRKGKISVRHGVCLLKSISKHLGTWSCGLSLCVIWQYCLRAFNCY